MLLLLLLRKVLLLMLLLDHLHLLLLGSPLKSKLGRLVLSQLKA